MGILSRKITTFLKKVADLPDRPGGTVTTSALKAQFDSSPEELRVAHNGLIDDLSSTSAGTSGAHQIGSETIAGVTGTNVFAQLSDIKTQINQAVTGQIPPGSITPDKLSFVPVKSTDYTAADVLAKLLTVDGPSSGIDAATVSGWKFRNSNNYVEYSTDGGGSWNPVSNPTMGYARHITYQVPTNSYPAAQWFTVLDVSGKVGQLNMLNCWAGGTANNAGNQYRVTIDGIAETRSTPSSNTLANSYQNQPIGGASTTPSSAADPIYFRNQLKVEVYIMNGTTADSSVGSSYNCNIDYKLGFGTP